MEYWYEFWLANFVVTSIGFALISVVVLVGGIKDISQMFSALQRSHENKHDPDSRDHPK